MPLLGANRINMSHKVVIIGGGFGGLNAAISLRRADVEVTLVDRQNYHLFQPLLYQVATGQLSPANIAAPLRNVLRRQKNAHVLRGEVQDFDLIKNEVVVQGERVPFDTLVVAAGMTHSYFGHDDWQDDAPGLKSIEEATEIRHRVLLAFERAEWEEDPERRRRLLTFVIVGGGPTGVELAGALAELSRHTLTNEFRNINPEDARILLVDAVDRVLNVYPESLSAKATEALHRLGVEIHTGSMVKQIDDRGASLESNGVEQRVDANTVIWAAGVKASPLAIKLAAAAGDQVETDRAGRLYVAPDLSLPGHPNVFVIGDMSHLVDKSGDLVPGVAPAAIQQGQYVAKVIGRRRRGKTVQPFDYRDYGSLATIGRAAAVAKLGKFKFSGYFAWLLWLFIHLMQLVRFENRVLVFLQWMWNYVTRGRSARLITGVDHNTPLGHDRQFEAQPEPEPELVNS